MNTPLSRQCHSENVSTPAQQIFTTHCKWSHERQVILTKCADGVVDARRSTMDDFLSYERPAINEMQVSVSQLHSAVTVIRLRRRRDVSKADEKRCNEARWKCCRTTKSCTCWQLWVDRYMYARHSTAMQQTTAFCYRWYLVLVSPVGQAG